MTTSWPPRPDSSRCVHLFIIQQFGFYFFTVNVHANTSYPPESRRQCALFNELHTAIYVLILQFNYTRIVAQTFRTGITTSDIKTVVL